MKFITLLTTAVALVAQSDALIVPRQQSSSATGASALVQKKSTTTTSSTRTSSSTKTSTTTTSSKVSSTSSSSSSRPLSSSTTTFTTSTRPSAPTTTTTTTTSSSSASAPTSTGGPLVFAHYMLLTRPPNGDYTNDMQLAKAAGIDAFAVNYGGWNVDYNVQNSYLTQFFDAAAANGMKAFLSIDCTSSGYNGQMNAQMAINLFNTANSKSAQLYIGGKPVLSSFQDWNGCPWNWKNDVFSQISAAKQPYFMPSSLDTSASNIFSQDVGASGYFPWLHPYKNAVDESNIDAAMAQQRTSTGKKWMAPLAPWFFKRFDSNNNWAHAQDGDMLVTRALNLLKLKPDFIQLTTWNDWGESSYFGPYDTANSCPSCYWADKDHSGALSVVSTIIKAYKAGQTSISSGTLGASENAWIYYRLQPNDVIGSSGDNGLGLPQNYDSLTQRVFVVGLFNSPTTVTVTSGGNTQQLSFPAGLSQQAINWSYGTQSVSASRNGQTIVSQKTGSKQIQGQLYRYDGNVVWV